MAYRTLPGETQYQARVRIAREKGASSYREWRKLPPAVRAEKTRAREIKVAAERPRSRQRLYRTPHGETLHSTNVREIRAFLNRAARADRHVTGTVTVEYFEEGERLTAEIPLWSHGGIDPSTLLDDIPSGTLKGELVDWLFDYVIDAGWTSYAGVHFPAEEIVTGEIRGYIAAIELTAVD